MPHTSRPRRITGQPDRPDRRDRPVQPARRSHGTVLASHLRGSRDPARRAGGPTPDWSPREVAEYFEARVRVPEGAGERFAGYGVMGLPLASGDVLALRRFPASSLGAPYTAVWHRDPAGRWTFYTDVHSSVGCQRYTGPMVDASVVTDIRLVWTGARSFTVLAAEAGLEWSVRLAATPATWLMTRALARLPDRAWADARAVALLGRAGGTLMGTGPLVLAGRMPSGHRFLVRPSHVWRVVESRARLAGRSLGPAAVGRETVRIGDFRLPRRGLFAASRAWLVR